MKKLSLSLVITLLCYTFTFAQDKKDSEPYNNWEIGINAGIQNYSGDFNMYKESRWNHFNHWKPIVTPGLGLSIRKNFSYVFALEGAWNYTSLTGKWNEAGTYPNFRTRISEFDLNSVWNINNLFSRNKFDRKIYWYAKLGLGTSYIKNMVSISAPTSGPDWSDGNHFKPTYDAGTGIAFRLNDKFKLNVGTQWSWVNTDRLDGKSEYPGITMKPGGNVPNVFETKLYTYVGLSYTFGKKKKPAPMPVIVEVKPEPKPEPIPEVKPEPKPEPAPVVVVPAVVGNVYTIKFGLNFAFDKWNLDTHSTGELDRLVKDLTDNPSVDVEIKSHTDSRGAASYNITLSEKRGKSVSDYLIRKGIDASRIKSYALGETQLLNKCADGVKCTAAEHAINRRSVATIVIRK